MTPAAQVDIDDLMQRVFHTARTARSEPYKAGTKALLMHRAHRVNLVCPHVAGSCEFDAFYSGVDEGHLIWSRYQKGEFA